MGGLGRVRPHLHRKIAPRGHRGLYGPFATRHTGQGGVPIMSLPLLGLFGVLVLWAAKQGRWAVVLLAVVCFFD